jgi:Flp pilus assembly pilin Flp
MPRCGDLRGSRERVSFHGRHATCTEWHWIAAHLSPKRLQQNTLTSCVKRPNVGSPSRADGMGPWPFPRSLATSRRGAALAEYAVLGALILVGLIGLLFGMQSNLRKIYTKADTQMGLADCASSAGSCSVASSNGGGAGPSGGSGSSAGASSGSGGTGGSGSSGSGSVLGAGDETPTSGPSVSTGSGGGSGGSLPQPGLQVPPQATSP